MTVLSAADVVINSGLLQIYGFDNRPYMALKSFMVYGLISLLPSQFQTTYVVRACVFSGAVLLSVSI